MQLHKRRLTKKEVKECSQLVDKAPQDAKPTIRQLCRVFGVTKPSLLKSLGGWKGIERGRPTPPPPSPKKVFEPSSLEIPKINFEPRSVDTSNIRI